ncbi:MAG: DMT family transporter [bacterium]|nr:DMT family transporter [bacterium]
MDIFNSWQSNLFLYYIFVVIFYQTYKLAVQHAIKDGAATIFLQLIAGLSCLFLIPFFPLKFSSGTAIWLLLVGACLFYALNDRLQTTVRKNLPVSTFSIIGQSTTIFLLIISVLFFNGSLGINKIVGAILIIVANIILFYKRDGIVLNKYFWLTLLASLSFAIAISIDVGISQNFNLPLYVALTLFIPALMIALADKLHIKEIVAESKSLNLKYYVITGISWALTIVFSLRTYQLGEVSIMVSLQAVSVLLNVIVASIILKERADIYKKIIAATLVIIGVYLTV